MQKTALVIMAAGIGSRFGKGIKQLAPVGPCGEIIMDYSIHDALEAGFNKIIFIIKLGRVHKNTYHRYFILVYTMLYKRCVPCMQSTHSRHQPHLFTLGFQNRKFSLQVLDRMYYFHFNWFMILSCLKNGAK